MGQYRFEESRWGGIKEVDTTVSTHLELILVLNFPQKDISLIALSLMHGRL